MRWKIAITAAEIAEKVDGRLEGDGSLIVRGAAPLDQAEPDELSWFGHAKYLKRFQDTRAAVIIAPRDCELPDGFTIIRVDDPDLAMCTALQVLAPPIEPVTPGVHPSAQIGEGAVVEGASIGHGCTVGRNAVVGPGTQLHPGVFIGDEARVGRDCTFWPSVVVRERVRIGDRVIIHPNATIGADGFSYIVREGRHVSVPQIGTVVIEDDVEIGANTCIDRARTGFTRIGAGTKIDNLVQIGHNSEIGEHCIVVAQCGVSGSCKLGRHVVLAGHVGVGDHLELGDGVQVAAMSGVSKSFPPGTLLRGVPAVEYQTFMREAAAARRLPRVLEQLRELTKRVQQLESSADNPE